MGFVWDNPGEPVPEKNINQLEIMSSNPSLSTVYLEFYLVALHHTSI